MKSLSDCQWKCPGLCQLQTLNPEREGVRNKKKRTFFQSVRRSLSVRRATRRIRSRSRKTERMAYELLEPPFTTALLTY